MLSIIPNLPPHVLGVTASGEVSKQDIDDVLKPAVDSLVEYADGIHYLLVLDNSIGNWEFGAWMSDALVGIKHFTKWHKVAVVSNEKAVENFTKVFNVFVPGKSKTYSHADIAEAIAWVSAHDSKDKVISPVV